MHTAELDSASGNTLRSLTPRWDTHCGARLQGEMQTMELNSAVGCLPSAKLDSAVCITQRSQTNSKMSSGSVKRFCKQFLTYIYFSILISSCITEKLHF